MSNIFLQAYSNTGIPAKYSDTGKIFPCWTDFELTMDIHEYWVRAQLSIFVLCVTAVRSSVFRVDWGEGMSLTWFPEQRLVVLEPGVLSCWVGITAAAQSHWTALLYFTRGTWIHRYVFRPIWRHIETCQIICTFKFMTVLTKMKIPLWWGLGSQIMLKFGIMFYSHFTLIEMKKHLSPSLFWVSQRYRPESEDRIHLKMSCCPWFMYLEEPSLLTLNQV